MRTRSTFSVNFWINTSRMKNGNAKLYARVTIASKRVNLSLKYTILSLNGIAMHPALLEGAKDPEKSTII